MLNAPFPQHPGQIPEKSTTMWSTPISPQQQRYFSKHAPKRRAYGLIQSVLQVLHAFLAFSAWFALFTWAFEKVPVLQPSAPWLASVLLIALHALFRVTWDTYWYDRLDKDDRTDSSIFIPLAIMAVLLFTEAHGARIFLEQQVKPADIQTTQSVSDAQEQQIAKLDQRYRQQVTDIETVYKEKSHAAALPYQNRIAALRKRKIDDEGERRSIYNQIAEQERQRDAALAPIAAAKAAELEKALGGYQSSADRIKIRTEEETNRITGRNTAEQQRYEADMSSAGSISWIISFILLALIAALGYARVRINVNSGILPKRNFTVLDAHGSVIERIATAFGDAFNRRSLQFAVWTHRLLSPNHELQSFDGTVVARPGNYNTPKGSFVHPNNTTLPSESDLLGAAYQKVSEKVAILQENHPGYVPGQEVLNRELNKALQMNGSYGASPWEDDNLGKP
jgi:hypothetical protein